MHDIDISKIKVNDYLHIKSLNDPLENIICLVCFDGNKDLYSLVTIIDNKDTLLQGCMFTDFYNDLPTLISSLLDVWTIVAILSPKINYDGVI